MCSYLAFEAHNSIEYVLGFVTSLNTITSILQLLHFEIITLLLRIIQLCYRVCISFLKLLGSWIPHPHPKSQFQLNTYI